MYKQIDSRDCSLYVFIHLANKYYNEQYDINQLKLNVSYDEEGISLFHFQKTLSQYQYQLQSFKCGAKDFEKLDVDEYPLAAIILNQNMQHMVLIEEVQGNKLLIYDPKQGRIKQDKNIFLKLYRGILVKISKDKAAQKQIIKKYRNTYFGGLSISIKLIFMYLLQIIISLITPLTTKYIFENIIPFHLKKELWLMSGFFIILFVIISLIQIMIMRIFENKVLTSYSKEFNNLLKSWSHQNIKIINQLGEIEIKNRISSLMNYLIHKKTFLSKVFVNIISFIISLIIIFAINKKLLFVVGAFGIITSVFASIYMFWYFKNKNQIVAQSILTDKQINNYINILKDNFDYTFANLYQKNLLNDYAAYIQENSNFNLQMQNFNHFELFLDVFYPFCILIYGTFQIWSQNLKVYELLFFITASNLFIRPLKFIPQALQMSKDYKISKTMLNIFRTGKPVNSNLLENINSIDKIHLSYVSFSYNSNPNYKVVNIPRLIIDQKHIIKGDNGSGKTTLCNIISGKYQIDYGEILINDQKINLHNNQIREKIYYVGDKNQKLDMSISEYLMISDSFGFNDTINRFRLYPILKKANLDDIENININSLSSGQMQIIKLLRIFILDYDVVLLDEAFESISQEIFLMVQKPLRYILKNKKVVEISHNNKYLFADSQVINLEKVQN
ncbi:Mbov_0121 family peptidase domain-containing ABC transporter [Mycoplasma sp. 246B]